MAVYKEARELRTAMDSMMPIYNDAADCGIPFYGNDSDNKSIISDIKSIVELYSDSKCRTGSGKKGLTYPAVEIKLDFGFPGIIEAGFSNATIQYFQFTEKDTRHPSMVSNFKTAKGFIYVEVLNSKKAEKEYKEYRKNE